MNYREVTPPPQLLPYIKCLWRLSGESNGLTEPDPIVPDGCMEIILNLADPFVRYESDKPPETQSLMLVAGQLTRASRIGPTARVNVWGIRFHPWSAGAFLGLSAGELRDEILDLNSVHPAICRSFAPLADIREDDDQQSFLIQILTQQACRVPSARASLPALVRFAQNRRDYVSVNRLAKDVGLSSRRVQMLFRDHVGLSPKQLLRIDRFQRALALSRARPTLSWSAIAADAGYHDHAHLLHESRAIVGCTPSVLLGRASELTSAFLSE